MSMSMATFMEGVDSQDPNMMDILYEIMDSDNYTVLITAVVVVSSFVVVSVVVVLWKRLFPAKQKKKVMVVKQTKCVKTQRTYLINVVTGSRRGAGTGDFVQLTLTGKQAQSLTFNLNPFLHDPDKRTLRRGSLYKCILVTEEELGDLYLAELELHCTERAKWFLSYMVVQDMTTYRQWYFPYHDWVWALDGCQTRVTLVPGIVSQLRLVGDNFLRGLRKHHIWRKLLVHLKNSNVYNAILSLSYCNCLSLCFILANAMVYRALTYSGDFSPSYTKSVLLSMASNLIVSLVTSFLEVGVVSIEHRNRFEYIEDSGTIKEDDTEWMDPEGNRLKQLNSSLWKLNADGNYEGFGYPGDEVLDDEVFQKDDGHGTLKAPSPRIPLMYNPPLRSAMRSPFAAVGLPRDLAQATDSTYQNLDQERKNLRKGIHWNTEAELRVFTKDSPASSPLPGQRVKSLNSHSWNAPDTESKFTGGPPVPRYFSETDAMDLVIEKDGRSKNNQPRSPIVNPKQQQVKVNQSKAETMNKPVSRALFTGSPLAPKHFPSDESQGRSLKFVAAVEKPQKVPVKVKPLKSSRFTGSPPVSSDSQDSEDYEEETNVSVFRPVVNYQTTGVLAEGIVAREEDGRSGHKDYDSDDQDKEDLEVFQTMHGQIGRRLNEVAKRQKMAKANREIANEKARKSAQDKAENKEMKKTTFSEEVDIVYESGMTGEIEGKTVTDEKKNAFEKNERVKLRSEKVDNIISDRIEEFLIAKTQMSDLDRDEVRRILRSETNAPPHPTPSNSQEDVVIDNQSGILSPRVETEGKDSIGRMEVSDEVKAEVAPVVFSLLEGFVMSIQKCLVLGKDMKGEALREMERQLVNVVENTKMSPRTANLVRASDEIASVGEKVNLMEDATMEERLVMASGLDKQKVEIEIHQAELSDEKMLSTEDKQGNFSSSFIINVNPDNDTAEGVKGIQQPNVDFNEKRSNSDVKTDNSTSENEKADPLIQRRVSNLENVSVAYTENNASNSVKKRCFSFENVPKVGDFQQQKNIVDILDNLDLGPVSRKLSDVVVGQAYTSNMDRVERKAEDILNSSRASRDNLFGELRSALNIDPATPTFRASINVDIDALAGEEEIETEEKEAKVHDMLQVPTEKVCTSLEIQPEVKERHVVATIPLDIEAKVKDEHVIKIDDHVVRKIPLEVAAKVKDEHVIKVAEATLQSVLSQDVTSRFQETVKEYGRAEVCAFASDVVGSLYEMVRQKLKSLLRLELEIDRLDSEGQIERSTGQVEEERWFQYQSLLRAADVEVKSEILPVITDHLVRLVVEEAQTLATIDVDLMMLAYGGQFVETVVTNAVLQTHVGLVKGAKVLLGPKKGQSLNAQSHGERVGHTTMNGGKTFSQQEYTRTEERRQQSSFTQQEMGSLDMKQVLAKVVESLHEKLGHKSKSSLEELTEETIHCGLCKPKVVKDITERLVHMSAAKYITSQVFAKALDELCGFQDSCYTARDLDQNSGREGGRGIDSQMREDQRNTLLRRVGNTLKGCHGTEIETGCHEDRDVVESIVGDLTEYIVESSCNGVADHLIGLMGLEHLNDSNDDHSEDISEMIERRVRQMLTCQQETDDDTGSPGNSNCNAAGDPLEKRIDEKLVASLPAELEEIRALVLDQNRKPQADLGSSLTSNQMESEGSSYHMYYYDDLKKYRIVTKSWVFFLVFGAIIALSLTCFIWSILIGLRFDDDMATQWLISVSLAIFQHMFLLETIKVFFLAIIVSICGGRLL